MTPAKKSSFDEAIIYIDILDSKTLLSADAFTTIRYLERETLRVKDEQKMAILHPRYSTKVLSFTSRGDYFASITHDAKEAKLYETKSKKEIAAVDRHQGEVACVSIDPQERYMFSCGDDGGIFGVDIKSGALALTLPRHLDIVNDIAFSSDGNIVATASYDKNISLFNLAMMLPKGKLKQHSAPVLKIAFLSQERLLSIDKKSKGYVWDINTLKVVARLEEIHDDVTQIAIAHKNGFIFLGTKLGYILVYDLHTYELISRRYIKFDHAITALCFDESAEQLIVATDDGELLCYAVFQDEESFSQLVKEKKYTLMLKAIEENPLLKYTKASKAFDAVWEKTLQRAKEFLERNDKANALKLFESFSAIPSKRQFAQKLVQEYAEYEKLLMFIKNKKISLAYGLANAHPVYKDTKVYKAMEAQWEKTFALAKKYLLDPKLSHKAQEILMPYRGISEKTALIQELVLNVQVYRRFRASISQQEFKLSFELVKQNPFLKEYPEYKALIHYSDSLYMRAQTLLGNGDTHAAVKIFRLLLDFDDFKDEAKEIILDIENQHRFFHAIETQNMIAAYNLLDASPTLQNTQDGKRLQREWEEDFEKANEYALRADFDSIKTVLEKYMKIRSKNMDIANIFSLLHITQLKNSMKLKAEQKTVENGIKNYILYYGLTEAVREFFLLFQAQYPESKLNIESQVCGKISRWRPSMAVESIL